MDGVLWLFLFFPIQIHDSYEKKLKIPSFNHSNCMEKAAKKYCLNSKKSVKTFCRLASPMLSVESTCRFRGNTWRFLTCTTYTFYTNCRNYWSHLQCKWPIMKNKNESDKLWCLGAFFIITVVTFLMVMYFPLIFVCLFVFRKECKIDCYYKKTVTWEKSLLWILL